MRVQAEDLDEGDNAALTYFIPQGIADGLFSVDESGMIRTTGKLDREQKSRYSFSGKLRSQ